VEDDECQKKTAESGTPRVHGRWPSASLIREQAFSGTLRGGQFFEIKVRRVAYLYRRSLQLTPGENIKDPATDFVIQAMTILHVDMLVLFHSSCGCLVNSFLLSS
jgi:hypothetical protein